MKDNMQKQRGFTLIELLIAMTIFAIGLLAIAGMQITAIHANSKSNTLTVATSLAQQVMEDLLSKDPTDPFYATATPPNTTYDQFDPVPSTTITVPGAGTYSATYSVQPGGSGTSMENVTTITVTVSGANRTVTLTGFKRAI
jgi:type IV pilus assembly protein PilV